MHVANIIEDARIAGPQIRNLKVAKALKKKIYVTLIFPKKNSNKLKTQCILFGIKYLSLSLTTIKRSLLGTFLYMLYFPIETIMLARILKKNKFDLVHVSGGCWQLKGVFAAKLASIKVIWELNDTRSPILIRSIFYFLSHLANGFIFASERTREYYRKLIPSSKNSFIIQSPVDTNLFDPDLKFKKNINLKKKIIVGTVGNINPNKDHITFINIAKRLSLYEKQIIFLIAGPIYKSQKKYYKFLKNLIKSNKITNIYFVNAISDIRPFLKSIDIYVCSSNNESSPLAVWEAMAMKKPIVSTDVGDVKKFIKNGINGYLANVSDSKGLAEGIVKLIKNPILQKKFGALSRKVVKNKLNLNLCAKLYLKAFYKIYYL
jgi:glycosyltransferase involved in cell wall biosynthesis